ncbi:MAG: PTS glucose transporter subunit IIA [Ruaniaceae bacterium]|nr:PTS glucose transporter subunit IIA [Ruaniaceae bacterium]
MIVAPLAGTVHPLAYADDPAFAMLGAGVAIEPSGSHAIVVSPVNGTIASLHPHAFAIDDGEGGVLVHLGINSFEHVEAFELVSKVGQVVMSGDPVIRWEVDATRGAGLNPVVVVVAMTRTAVIPTPASSVEANEPLFTF